MERKEITDSVKEYGRGIIGGLLFSIPLLYTMEVWWTGFIATPEKLLAYIGVTYFILVGYNEYAGIREDASFKDNLHESVEEIGLAFIITFLFLWMIDKVDLSMSYREIAGKVIVESLLVAIGISVSTAQLGGQEDKDRGRQGKKKDKSLTHVIILSFCGGVFISSSVAPTEEILMLAVESSPVQLLLMVLASLAIAAITLFFSDFKGSGKPEGGSREIILHVLICYMIALIISLLMLWFFGRIQGYSLQVVIAEVIVLAIPASLGGSAGRLLL